MSEIILHRLPKRVRAFQFNGSNLVDLETWMQSFRPNATVTATTDPVGAYYYEYDTDEWQILVGQYVLIGSDEWRDDMLGHFKVVNDLAGFREYPAEWLSEF